jgi:hypothetical protein
MGVVVVVYVGVYTYIKNRDLSRELGTYVACHSQNEIGAAYAGPYVFNELEV